MYLTIIAVSILFFFISNIRGQPFESIPDSNSFTRDSEDLCPNSILSYPITNNTDSHCLQENSENIQQCILSNFNQTSTFCSFCVIVNPSTFEDESDCECVKCVLETLTNNNCFQVICNEKELVLSHDSIANIQSVTKDNFKMVTDDVKERIIEKYGNTLKQINHLQYLTDESTGRVFRNFLPFEQKNLIKRLLNSWVENKNNDNNYDNNYDDDDDDDDTSTDSMVSDNTIKDEEFLENEATINKEENHINHLFHHSWLKMGDKTFKTKTNPKVENKTSSEPIFTVKNEVKPVLIPTTITKTILHSTKALNTETKTKLQAANTYTTVTKTDHTFKNKPKTITRTKLEKTIHWESELRTKQNTKYIEKWKTKTEARFQIVTLTETNVKFTTNTISRHDIVTFTATKINEIIETKVIPKTTITSTATKTTFKEKIITVTNVATDVSIFTKKKKKLTVTATQLITRTKVVTKKKCKVTKIKTSTKKTTKTFTIKQDGVTKKRRIGRMLLGEDETATLNKRNLISKCTSCLNVTTSSKNTTFPEIQSSIITSVTPKSTELEIINKASASRTLPFPKPFVKMAITISLSSLFLFSLIYFTPKINNKEIVELTKGKNNGVKETKIKKEINLKNSPLDDLIINLGVD